MKESVEEKGNVIKKCLFFLKLIIEESEKKGTARIKSHSGLLKVKVIRLRVVSQMAKHQNDFSLKIYANTTVWDLRELISAKVQIGVDFLRIIVDGKDLQSSDNGKTVTEINVKF